MTDQSSSVGSPSQPATSSSTVDTAAMDGVRLTDMAAIEVTGEFFVPAYQRGYRWGPVEVTALLQDIAESRGERYYLQPVVVKHIADDRWELVDGQQRLTTLYLILLYIRRENLLPTAHARYTMEYETRPGSRTYLEDPVAGPHERNIDYFHIYHAYQAIDAWFQDQGAGKLNAAITFYQALSDKVRIIWYEAAAEVDGTELFTRLNVGRIPLTDAELVKALILSRSRADQAHADRAQEIVAQWDGIERDLRVPEVWSFITGSAAENPTHISLLLDTIAGHDPDRHGLFHTFEEIRRRVDQTTPDEVWGQIVDMHSLVRGWFDDRDLYHWVGYLVATGTPFRDLVAAGRDTTKSEFRDLLSQRIRAQLNLTAADVADLTYQQPRTEDVLLLMNVETVRRTVGSTERYSFRNHASGAWSLEHIHAQNAERLNRAEQWDEWLRLHAAALQHLPDLDDSTRADLLARIEVARQDVTEAKFRALEPELVAVFSTAEDTEVTDVHSIANLALLGRDVNSALNNSCFEVKRREIITKDMNGEYIPVCTRNAFLKYYTDAESQQIQFWGAEDRVGYLNHLISTVAPYLRTDAEVSA